MTRLVRGLIDDGRRNGLYLPALVMSERIVDRVARVPEIAAILRRGAPDALLVLDAAQSAGSLTAEMTSSVEQMAGIAFDPQDQVRRLGV